MRKKLIASYRAKLVVKPIGGFYRSWSQSESELQKTRCCLINLIWVWSDQLIFSWGLKRNQMKFFAQVSDIPLEKLSLGPPKSNADAQTRSAPIGLEGRRGWVAWYR